MATLTDLRNHLSGTFLVAVGHKRAYLDDQFFLVRAEVLEGHLAGTGEPKHNPTLFAVETGKN